MLKFIVRAGAVLAALAAAAAPASAQDRFALVIGNSNYKSVSPLANPARDAQAVGVLLRDAGFQVTSALDLDKTNMSRVIRFFTTSIAEKPENTVALIYFAGHGVQVDGENFLMPVDATIAREADVPLEALRMSDLMAMLETIRSKTRIVILDACRDNPFGDIAKTAPRGLALVNAPAGTLLAYSTSPGHTASDGAGSNSPFASALIRAAREPGLPIEAALKNVRLAVHDTTGGGQTPWEVSALTEPFSFFPGAGKPQAARNAEKTADVWRKELQGLSARDAFSVAVREDNVIVYEQYVALYGSDPFAGRLRAILDRRLMMLAWQEAVALNSAAGFAAFLAQYPNSDLSATARRLQQRAQNRVALAPALGAANAIQAAVSPGGTCPCSVPGGPGSPAAPGAPSVPPGTRASIPVTPVTPVTPVPPGGPVVPGGPGGPILVPETPTYVPIIPVIPPRITDPGRVRDPHRPDSSRYPDGNRGGGKSDQGKSDPGKPSGGTNATSSATPGAGKPGSAGTKPDHDKRGNRDSVDKRGNRDSIGNRARSANQDRLSEPRTGNRGNRIGNVGRIQNQSAPRIAPPPRIAAPRAAVPRFDAPRGGAIRMGGGGGLRMGGGGARMFGGGGRGLRLR